MIINKIFGEYINYLYSIAKRKEFDLEDKIKAMLYQEIHHYQNIDNRDVITAKHWLESLVTSYNNMLTRCSGIVDGTYPISDNSDGYFSTLKTEMERKIRKTSRVLEVINEYITLLHLKDDTKGPKGEHLNWEAKTSDLTLGDRIEKRLNIVGITQRELSDLTGITEAKITRYINNEKEPGSFDMTKLSIALETTVEYLCGADDEME